jgi:hypothetical protein
VSPATAGQRFGLPLALEASPFGRMPGAGMGGERAVLQEELNARAQRAAELARLHSPVGAGFMGAGEIPFHMRNRAPILDEADPLLMGATKRSRRGLRGFDFAGRDLTHDPPAWQQALGLLGLPQRLPTAQEFGLGAVGGLRGFARDMGHSIPGAINAAGASMATGDPRYALDASVDLVARSLGKIPVVGDAAATGLRSVAAAAQAFSGFMDAHLERGKQLGNLDPRIAQAQAEADVRQILRDYREAQSMGGEYARLIRQDAEMKDTLSRELQPIRMWLLERGNNLLENLSNKLESQGGLVNGLVDIGQKVLMVLSAIPVIGSATPLISDLLKAMQKDLEEMRDRMLLEGLEDGRSALESVMKVLDGAVRNGPAGPGQREDATGGRLFPQRNPVL